MTVVLWIQSLAYVTLKLSQGFTITLLIGWALFTNRKHVVIANNWNLCDKVKIDYQWYCISFIFAYLRNMMWFAHPVYFKLELSLFSTGRVTDMSNWHVRSHKLPLQQTDQTYYTIGFVFWPTLIIQCTVVGPVVSKFSWHVQFTWDWQCFPGNNLFP